MTPLNECPFCKTERHSVAITGKLKYCTTCHIVYNTDPDILKYNDSYFLDEYREQYGKTYQEDFDTIYGLAGERLFRIINILGRDFAVSEISLLDVGSALGFFLKSAMDSGIRNVTGIEISEYAADYTEKNYNIHVINEPFNSNLLAPSFSVITAWYFIEHLTDPLEAIQSIYHHLEAGGVFACSVPALGPLYHCDQDDWISSRPGDHRTDFTRKGIKKILKKAGFKKIIVRAAGFHPERILNTTNPFFPVFVPLYRLFTRLTAYSDTIEVYAKK